MPAEETTPSRRGGARPDSGRPAVSASAKKKKKDPHTHIHAHEEVHLDDDLRTKGMCTDSFHSLPRADDDDDDDGQYNCAASSKTLPGATPDGYENNRPVVKNCCSKGCCSVIFTYCFSFETVNTDLVRHGVVSATPGSHDPSF